MTRFTIDAAATGVSGRVLTGVSGSFTAQHVCCEPEPHEHTWHVTAWFETPAPADARRYQAALDALLSSWANGVLPVEVEWGEDMARAIGRLVDCVEVMVERPRERILARWIA